MTRFTCIAAFGVVGWMLVGAICGAATPQPRVRLHREASVAVARLEEETAATENAAVVLEKFVVRDFKLPSGPRPLQEEKRSSFSLLKGGPLMEKRTKFSDVSIGVWRTAEMFEEEARFKPMKTRAEFDLVRIRR